jgi:hypothetical protein
VRSHSPSTQAVLALPVGIPHVGAIRDDVPLASSAIPVINEDIFHECSTGEYCSSC